MRVETLGTERIHVETLWEEDCEEYENLVWLSRNGMYSHTLSWIRVLQRFTGAEPYILVAKAAGRIVGVLPSLMKRNVKYGNVLNSLPFFGTHGGPLVLPWLNEIDRLEVKQSLLIAFKMLAKENDCVFSTLITTPFEVDVDVVHDVLQPSFVDARITQMTLLPQHNMANIENEILYNVVEKRCRNAIRKAQKSGMEVELARDMSNFDALVRMHTEGMTRKKGVPKPRTFFDSLLSEYAGCQNKDFKLFFAWKDGKIIAGLLVFYFNRIAEYFTPAFDVDYSSLQPNSLLIFEAMKDALRNGFNVWNFGGGTRLSGVYMFKRAWGPKDFPYCYYVNVYGDSDRIRCLQQEEILSEYEWFYVLPFSELRGAH